MRKINDFIKNNAGFVIAGMALVCLVMFFIMLIIGIIIVLWLFLGGGLQFLGTTCILFAVPIFLIVISAILVKRHLLGGKK